MRRGAASSRGAITILNAIPTGIGAAMGITLQTDAEVTIADGKSGIKVKLEEKEEDDTLAKECVKGIFDFLKEELMDVNVRTSSSIPISRGLKSSSAAANSISLATARALEKKIDDLTIIKLGVEAAKRAGVTVTGAFDDATACYFGGIAVTDNSRMDILKKHAQPKDNLRVVLHIPERKIRKKGISKNSFSSYAKEFKDVEKLVLDGDYLRAMTANGHLVAESLGIDDRVAKCALDAGAISAGISGTGPATAIVVEEKFFNDVLDAVTDNYSIVIAAHLNDTPAPEVKPRF